MYTLQQEPTYEYIQVRVHKIREHSESILHVSQIIDTRNEVVHKVTYTVRVKDDTLYTDVRVYMYVLN